MNVTTTTTSGVWKTVPLTCEVRSDREIWTEVYEGDYDSIVSQAANFYVGNSTIFNASDSFYQGSIICGAVRIARKVGGLATLTISYVALYKLEIWNIDFSETSKDIRCWLAKQYTDTNGTVREDAYYELALLTRWENYKDISWELYKDFKYSETEELPDKAKIVAQKILKGVTNYPVYSPVITRTTVHAFAPPVGTIGKKQNPATVSNGWHGFNNTSLSNQWLSLAKAFLKIAEKSNCNGDGTFTLVEQWLGADELDPDLYPSA